MPSRRHRLPLVALRACHVLCELSTGPDPAHESPPGAIDGIQAGIPDPAERRTSKNRDTSLAILRRSSSTTCARSGSTTVIPIAATSVASKAALGPPARSAWSACRAEIVLDALTSLSHSPWRNHVFRRPHFPEIELQAPIAFSAIDLPARVLLWGRRIFRALVTSLHCVTPPRRIERLETLGDTLGIYVRCVLPAPSRFYCRLCID